MKELFERIAQFQDKTFVHIGACRLEQMGDLCDCHKLGAEIKALLYDCQSAITELQRAVTCGCGDIRPLNETCHLCGACQMGCCECLSFEDAHKLRTKNAQLTGQLEKAEALLRRCEDEGWACLPEIAAYFREKEKP